MSTARFIVGDSLTVLRSMPDESVDFIVTSPPFLALRSYLPDDHPDKASEIGTEGSPAAFLDALLDVVEECARVLAPHGSLAFELGDTYADSGGAGGDYNPGGLRDGQPKFRRQPPNRSERFYSDGSVRTAALARATESKNREQLLPVVHHEALGKSLCMIPSAFAWALAYGRNPWTGRETPRWRVRNLKPWIRSNPPVGNPFDKERPATSYVTVACKDRGRYFDLDAVRTPSDKPVQTVMVGTASASKGVSGGDSGNPDKVRSTHNPAGGPPLDWSHLTDKVLDGALAQLAKKNERPTGRALRRALDAAGIFDPDYLDVSPGGYSGAHYAVFPPELVAPLIEEMCPLRVCRECGEPSRRITKPSERYASRPNAGKDINARRADGGGAMVAESRSRSMAGMTSAEYVTVGWSDCGHDDWRNGVVLDPFVGSGTTLVVAQGLGRDALGVDLDERNADLARERLGMFLEVEQGASV